MIGTKDIRIGNWICTEENQWGTVTSISRDAILVKHALGTQGYNPEDLFPISVTVDILSLCGFQVFNAGYRHKDSFFFLRYFGDGDLSLDIAGHAEKFSYVHQLQNLYYRLTGTLLEPYLYGN
ncbi:hypothetical protein [Flaviaesturariibacter amylovorans]|uniref:Uncharacterized protein n=1 Tax=Flaviaesturariibacter amylovorans TaxID=1084520 RepID=A0ABP8G3K3_9BACT